MKTFDMICAFSAANLFFVTVNAKEFANLDFESGVPTGLRDAVVSGVHVKAGNPKDLLPGWQVKYSGEVVTSIYYDTGPVRACLRSHEC
jgi:hypothetical protein